jgi:hypothetical protein
VGTQNAFAEEKRSFSNTKAKDNQWKYMKKKKLPVLLVLNKKL